MQLVSLTLMELMVGTVPIHLTVSIALFSASVSHIRCAFILYTTALVFSVHLFTYTVLPLKYTFIPAAKEM